MPISINDIPLSLLQDLTISWSEVENNDKAYNILKQVLSTRTKSEKVASQIQNICRLCLTESDITVEQLDSKTCQLAWKLLQIKISVNDTSLTPKTICSGCRRNLYNFSKFKDTCRNNQENLLTLRKIYFETVDESNLQEYVKEDMSEDNVVLNIVVENETFDSYLHAEQNSSVTGLGEKLPEQNKNLVTYTHLTEQNNPKLINVNIPIIPQKEEKNLQKHSHNFHLNTIECDICSESIPWNEFIKHESNCGKPLSPPPEECYVTCDKCGANLLNKFRLYIHMKQVHGEKVYKCKFCAYEATREIRVKEHETIHTQDKLYECNFFREKFRNSSNLYRHRQHLHPTEYKGMLEERKKYSSK